MRETVLEGVLAVFEDGELVAVARKNGAVKFYKTSPMGFDELAEFMGANNAKL